ncbi:hypothetical protein AC578_9679 [Pseudocercospora eumusae]|uniref:Uncharacterized protein n=1 Tax=Pseudocercospora eumusae TaxID=321146 RepID=A0A139HQJ4_9PEZI|nr:hypothetical protein AC578_9679 [Pseudocercospora eumusae]
MVFVGNARDKELVDAGLECRDIAPEERAGRMSDFLDGLRRTGATLACGPTTCSSTAWRKTSVQPPFASIVDSIIILERFRSPTIFRDRSYLSSFASFSFVSSDGSNPAVVHAASSVVQPPPNS